MAVTITDPKFVKKESHSALDNFILKFIRDERDLPIMHLVIQATLFFIPTTVVFFIPGVFRWWMAPIYWVILLGLFLDRLILALHNTSHRPLFKKQFEWANRWIPWFLGPYFGETPDTYFTHHMGMHHNENNMHDDLSSTLQYRRDKFTHFMHYWAKFFTIGLFELAVYFAKRGRWDFFWRTLLGEVAWYGTVVALAVWNFGPAFTLFIFPMIFTRFAMMAGNWGQHAFVDRDDPENNYRNSITCINTRYNRRCFNDGYHIGHHLRANRHWTDLPVEFERNMEKYGKERAIVFEGIDFFEVWLLLMMKNHKKLAEHMVDLDGERTVEEKMALIDERLNPIPPAPAVNPDMQAAAA